MFSCNNVVTVV